MDVVNPTRYRILRARGAKSIKFPNPPRTVRKNIEKIKEIRERGREKVAAKYDTEKFVVVVFSSREEKNRFLKSLGLPPDERYLLAQTVEDFLAGKLTPAGLKSGDPRKTGATG